MTVVARVEDGDCAGDDIGTVAHDDRAESAIFTACRFAHQKSQSVCEISRPSYAAILVDPVSEEQKLGKRVLAVGKFGFHSPFFRGIAPQVLS